MIRALELQRTYTLAPLSRNGARIGIVSSEKNAPLQCSVENDDALQQFQVIGVETDPPSVKQHYAFIVIGEKTSFWSGAARHLSAEPDGTLRTDSECVKVAEKFSVHHVEGGIVIQCCHGGYLGVTADGEVRCDFKEIGPETTMVVRHEVGDGVWEVMSH